MIINYVSRDEFAFIFPENKNLFRPHPKIFTSPTPHAQRERESFPAAFFFPVLFHHNSIITDFTLCKSSFVSHKAFPGLVSRTSSSLTLCVDVRSGCDVTTAENACFAAFSITLDEGIRKQFIFESLFGDGERCFFQEAASSFVSQS